MNQNVRHSFRSAMFTANYDRKSLSFIETNFMKTWTDIALPKECRMSSLAKL